MPRAKRALSTLGIGVASSALVLAGVSYSPAHANSTCPSGFATVGQVGSDPVCQLWRFGGSDFSWTVPVGVTSVDVLIVGGGGAGSNGADGGGGGGGGGAVRWEIGLAVSAGDRLDLEPGVGGTPGVTGGDGEASLFRHVLSPARLRDQLSGEKAPPLRRERTAKPVPWAAQREIQIPGIRGMWRVPLVARVATSVR